jgi:hypothetical protein
MVKVVGWYDNEIGYSSRIIDLILLTKSKTAERNKQQMRHLFWFVFYYFISILKLKRVQTAFPIIPTWRNVSVKENKYKDVLYFTQKAINYCDNNGKTEDQYKLII